MMPGQPMPTPAPQQGAGQPPITIDDVMELLRDGMMRRFRIDIEVDSTIAGDESQERQDRAAFIETTTKFVQAWGPVIQERPELTQLAGELLLFGVRAFRVGRSLEEVMEETVDKLEQSAMMPKPPPQPSPDELVKLEGTKAKVGAEVQKAGLGVQQAAQDAQAKQAQTKLDLVGKVMEHAHATAEHHQEMQRMNVEAATDARADLRQAELDAAKHQQAMAAAKKPKGDQ